MPLDNILRLPKKQQAAIPALLQEPTIRASAARAGVKEITLYRWLKQSQFQAAYREARYIIMDEAFTLLQKSCTEAAKTVISIMQDTDANPFVRLQAANAVLDMAVKSRAVDELEARIAALEETLD